MSLLDSMMESCTMMDRITSGDGVFGRNDRYVPGATFKATIIKDNSTEALIAEKQGVTEMFTVVTQKGFGLEYRDIFIRNSDNAIFRVTSNQVDSEAPKASSVKIGKVTAEKLEAFPT